MQERKPEISVIIPCRNEERYIGKIIEDLIFHNKDLSLEIIVVDGMSTDKTRDIVKSLSKKYPGIIKLIDNPARYVPHALNLGIKSARGDILIRMDAHAIYPPHYIETLIKYLKNEKDAWNVGPVVEPAPYGNALFQKSIAIAQKSIFGVGNSLWRLGVKKPTYADTTPFFCMKRETFEKLGLFNEKLIRNQDAEFNARIIKNGGKNLIIPDANVKVITRRDFKSLAKQYFEYGYYRALSTKILKKTFSYRAFVPPVFFTLLIFSLLFSFAFKPAFYFFCMLALSYIFGALLFSVYESIKAKNILFSFTLPLVYFIIHLSFALGFIIGYLRNIGNE